MVKNGMLLILLIWYFISQSCQMTRHIELSATLTLCFSRVFLVPVAFDYSLFLAAPKPCGFFSVGEPQTRQPWSEGLGVGAPCSAALSFYLLHLAPPPPSSDHIATVFHLYLAITSCYFLSSICIEPSLPQ